MRVARSLLLTFTVASVACAGDMATPLGADGPTPASAVPAVAEFVALVNAHRVSIGCSALVWHADVAAVAAAHSVDMVAREFFDHSNPDGLSPFDRIERAGIGYRAAGENIAFTSSGAQGVLDLWLGSSGHRQNIERCGYTHHGVGLEGTHWTHVFLEDPS